MDGDSSSDDEELNSVKKQIQHQQTEIKPSRKRKELSTASLPAEGDHMIVGEHDGGPALVGGKAFKENLHFPWLELVGPTCHSVKQVKAGIDLTHVKKKYRNMRCIICAQYNPSTPWAEVWARKFELQTLVDHAKSSAHVKSDTAFKSSPDYNADSEPLQSMIKVVSGSGKALQVDKAARDEALEAAAAAAVAAGIIDVDGFAGHGGAKSNVRIRGASGGGHVIAHSTRIRPDWLYSEGSLCLSDKQATDPTLAHNTKKKYKQMACLYCREYVPDSMWAQLRPRKFESAVIGDHERSACHQKALELRASRMGGVVDGQGHGQQGQQLQQQPQQQQQQQQPMLLQHAPLIHMPPHLQHAALDRLPNVTEVHHEVGETVTFV